MTTCAWKVFTARSLPVAVMILCGARPLAGAVLQEPATASAFAEDPTTLWFALLDSAEPVSRVQGLQSFRNSRFIQAPLPWLFSFNTDDFLRRLERMIAQDCSPLVRIEAGRCWLAWQDEQVCRRPRLRDVARLFVTSVPSEDQAIRTAAYRGSSEFAGIVPQCLSGPYRPFDPILGEVFAELRAQAAQSNWFREGADRGAPEDGQDRVTLFLSLLEWVPPSFGDNQQDIVALVKMALASRRSDVCVQLFAHHGEWLASPAVIPELVGLLSHTGQNNSGEIREAAKAHLLHMKNASQLRNELRDMLRSGTVPPEGTEAYVLGAALEMPEAIESLHAIIRRSLVVNRDANEVYRALLASEGPDVIPGIVDSLMRATGYDSAAVEDLGAMLAPQKGVVIPLLKRPQDDRNSLQRQLVDQLLQSMSR